MDILAAATARISRPLFFSIISKTCRTIGSLARLPIGSNEILLLALMSILAGAEGFTDMARFGQKKLPLLQRFLPFANGAPTTTTGADIFASLDPHAFRDGFVAWVGALDQAPTRSSPSTARPGALGRKADGPAMVFSLRGAAAPGPGST